MHLHTDDFYTYVRKGFVAPWLPAAQAQNIAYDVTTIDLGGTALEFLYCTDPDGVRVELMDLG